ncbi:D-sedoheptulose 7-phosphate isomerase [bacterium]|nr:D-sedoheptulose 7-phosphate isomerase [bacterium]
MTSKVQESFRQSSAVIWQLAVDRGFHKKLEAAAGRCIRAVRRGRKILTFGNGGSAADAQHFACELVGRFERERRAIPAIALNTNVSVLTSIGNDYGYDRVFERQVEAQGRRGDVVVAISTSGKSENVNRALRLAKKMGLYRIGLTGKTGGSMARLVELELRIPSVSTPRTQEAQITAIHILCDLIETAFAKKR